MTYVASGSKYPCLVTEADDLSAMLSMCKHVDFLCWLCIFFTAGFSEISEISSVIHWHFSDWLWLKAVPLCTLVNYHIQGSRKYWNSISNSKIKNIHAILSAKAEEIKLSEVWGKCDYRIFLRTSQKNSGQHFALNSQGLTYMWPWLGQLLFVKPDTLSAVLTECDVTGPTGRGGKTLRDVNHHRLIQCHHFLLGQEHRALYLSARPSELSRSFLFLWHVHT